MTYALNQTFLLNFLLYFVFIDLHYYCVDVALHAAVP